MICFPSRFRARILQIGGAAVLAVLSVSAYPTPGSGKEILSLNASAQESRNTMASTSTVSSGDNARFSCGRVLFLNESNHPLMLRVADLFRQLVKQVPQIQQLDEAEAMPQATRSKSASLLPSGSRAPDLFLRLELEQIQEEGWFTRSVKANMKVSLGTAPWESNHSVVDDSSPPLIDFRWTGELRHDGQIKGVEIPKYKSTSADIANQLANAVTNEILKQAREHGLLPGLPDNLYGPYRPAPNLPFPPELKTEPAFSYYGLLTHNETFWRLRAPANPVPQLEELVRRLTAAQWRTESVELTNAPHYYLRLKKGDLSLEVFNPSAFDHRELNAVPPPFVDLVAHYRERLTRSERTAALDRLLALPAPMETLLLFHSSYSSPQRARFTQLLKEHPIANPDALLILARECFGRKQTNNAISWLVQAKALAQALGDSSGVESKVDSLAQEIRPKGKLPLEITPDTYRALGFLEITNRSQRLELERDLGSPALLFSTDDHGELHTLALRVDAPVGKSRLANWTWIQSAPGTQSTRSGQVDLAHPSGWTQSAILGKHPIRARLTQAGTGDRVRFELEIEPAVSAR